MANIRTITSKFTKQETKELLDKTKQIIDDKVLGENFKRNKLINKKNEVKQDVKVDGSIIVSTPQELALMDVQRGIQMFDKTKIKILGLVDNMSFFKGDDGKKYNIFGEGGVEKTAKQFDKKFLGQIPISTQLRESADLGLPLTYKEPDNEISKIFLEIAKKIMQDVE